MINLSTERSFAGISSLIYKIIATPFSFRSTPKGLFKSLISNWLARKQSSNLVSKIIKILTLTLIWSLSKSKLFLPELILIWAIINLFGFKSQNCCRSLKPSELRVVHFSLGSLKRIGSSINSKLSIQFSIKLNYFLFGNFVLLLLLRCNFFVLRLFSEILLLSI